VYEGRRRLARPDLLVRTLSYALAVVALGLVGVAISIARADYPRLRLEHLAFRFLLPIGQRLLGLPQTVERTRLHGFVFEDPVTLEPLRHRFDLDAVVAAGANDFERWVLLMHWVRDRFPHYPNPDAPDADAFDGLALLERYRGEGGYLCGTIAPLLVQAVTALGGHARRVELRFTPGDSHVVVEVWSEHFHKWAVLDPDYDIFFTVDGVPQHALELHQHWAANRIDAVRIHWRESPHNIYRPDLEKGERRFLRGIYETRDFPRWDRERNQHKGERFAVRLLHYYTHVSFPLRNDWSSRPLPWWHPEGNHVQGSLVIALPTMPDWDDFLQRIPSPASFYVSPRAP
jgi:hypothetical protein